MADTKISNLITASTLDGTEYLGGVQGGNSRKITVNQVKTFALADGGGAASEGDLNVIQLSDGSDAFKASIVSIADDGTISVRLVDSETDNGRSIAILAGNSGETSGNGGSIDVNSGSPTAADGDGGSWGAHSGDAGSGAGEGGSLSLTSGLGGSTSGSGGDLNLTSGGSPTTGRGGGIYLAAGGATSGDGGDITLSPGATDGGGRNGEFILQNLPTEDTQTTDAIWVDPSTGELVQGGHQYSGPIVKRVKAVLSSVLTLNSDPPQILASPGANKINQVTSVSVTLLYGTSSYTGMDAPKLYYGASTSGAPVSTFLNFKDVMQNSQSCSQGDPDSGYSRNNLADLANQAIYLCDTGDAADGDGVTILNICYTTISVDNPS